jgi:hypothetical protein
MRRGRSVLNIERRAQVRTAGALKKIPNFIHGGVVCFAEIYLQDSQCSKIIENTITHHISVERTLGWVEFRHHAP